jgi:hypothetical protein
MFWDDRDSDFVVFARAGKIGTIGGHMGPPMGPKGPYPPMALCPPMPSWRTIEKVAAPHAVKNAT